MISDGFTDKDIRETREFVRSKRFLILDHGPGDRSAIQSALIDLGVEPRQIGVHKSFDPAREFVQSMKPEVIISEFQIDDNFGLDLVPLQLEYAHELQNRVFMVVTENATDSAVADAAEEQVDSYLLKPFTKDKVVEYLVKVVRAKLHPSEYVVLVAKAKKLIQEQQYEKALNLLSMAKVMGPKPTLACFYAGLCFERQKRLHEALQEYRQGLEFNPIHFKCMVGVFIVLNMQGNREEAYRALQRIAERFPLTPMLLKQAFLLAIYTYRYQDVEKYFEMYLKLPRKSQDLKTIVSAGLLTAGKFLVQEQKFARALDYFRKGAFITGHAPGYMNNVVNSLLKERLIEECKGFIASLDPTGLGPDLMRQLRFKLDASEKANPRFIMNEGRELILSGLADEFVYRTVLKSLKANNQPEHLIETVVRRGIADFPDLKAEFLAYIAS